jgi:hypothetical protein
VVQQNAIAVMSGMIQVFVLLFSIFGLWISGTVLYGKHQLRSAKYCYCVAGGIITAFLLNFGAIAFLLESETGRKLFSDLKTHDWVRWHLDNYVASAIAVGTACGIGVAYRWDVRSR